VILCWVDAGPAFGLGHVSRILALAEALAERGAGCRFALAPDPTALAWLAAARMPPPLRLAEPALAHVLAAARGARAVVVDVKHPLTAREGRALGGSCPLVVVDNAGPGAEAADLVVAPFGTAPAGAAARWLTGPEHVPLRRAVRAAAAGGRAREAGAAPVVVVSMGASDPGGLTVPAVEALGRARAAGVGLEARVVASPLMPAWGALGALLDRLGMPPPCLADPANMPAALAAADLAVLAMGVTVYEAMALGLPAIVLCRTSGDAEHARALEARGAVVSLGPHWTEERIAQAVAALAGAPERRAAMAHTGRALVDGRGAERVAKRLLRLVASRRREGGGRRPQA
jgi:spore coat polysaccharide biosynthesis protein SpsF